MQSPELYALLTSLWSGYVTVLHVTLFLLGMWLVRAALHRAGPSLQAHAHAAASMGMVVVAVLCWLPIGWWWAWILRGRGTPFESIGLAGIAADAAVSPRAWMLAAVWVVYVAGLAVSLCRVAMRGWLMRRISRRATPVVDGEWRQLLRDASGQMGTTRAVELRCSAEVATAVTWGVLAPVILIPEGADAWPVRHRRLVLLHELAHIRRADWLVRLLAQLSVAVFWFHPGAWASLHALVTAQEEACDALVVRMGARRSEYAECLLRSADWARGRARLLPGGLALGITSPPHIHRRVRELLGAPRPTPSRALRIASVAAVIVWLLASGSIRLAPRRDVAWLMRESPDVRTLREPSAVVRAIVEHLPH